MPGLIRERPGATESSRPGVAPTYEVPQQRVVGIEHPCVIQNFDNAVKSLGGEPQIKHVGIDSLLKALHSADVSPDP